MSLLSGDSAVCTEQAVPPRPSPAACSPIRRLPGRCYFCGDPSVGEWFCAAHLWAGDEPLSPVLANGLEHVTRYHAYWLKRFTPEQILELAGYLEAA